MSKLALTLAMMAAALGAPMRPRHEPDHSVRDARRMDLTKQELETLASLSGKDKKNYVKELRKKYNK